MPKTKIELGTFAWNPVVGCNNHCPYCWARNRIAPRLRHRCSLCGDFKPHIHFERLGQIKTKKPQRVLVCWNGDLFSDTTKQLGEQTGFDIVMSAALEQPQHKYLFLTKNPENIPARKYPDNWWFGTSITAWDEGCFCRSAELANCNKKAHKFLMIEPLLTDDILVMFEDALWNSLDWIVVGAQTGNKNAFRPKEETIREIIGFCADINMPLFLKDNLLKVFPELPKIQQFPEGLKI